MEKKVTFTWNLFNTIPVHPKILIVKCCSSYIKKTNFYIIFLVCFFTCIFSFFFFCFLFSFVHQSNNKSIYLKAICELLYKFHFCKGFQKGWYLSLVDSREKILRSIDFVHFKYNYSMHKKKKNLWCHKTIFNQNLRYRIINHCDCDFRNLF